MNPQLNSRPDTALKNQNASKFMQSICRIRWIQSSTTHSNVRAMGKWTWLQTCGLRIQIFNNKLDQPIATHILTLERRHKRLASDQWHRIFICGTKVHLFIHGILCEKGRSSTILDFQWVLLDFFEPMITTVSKWMISWSPRSILQGLNLGTLEKLFVSSHIFQRLKSLREVICKRNDDIPRKSDYFLAIFQS